MFAASVHLHVRVDQQDEGLGQQQHAGVAGTLARVPGAVSILCLCVGEDQAVVRALPCDSTHGLRSRTCT